MPTLDLLDQAFDEAGATLRAFKNDRPSVEAVDAFAHLAVECLKRKGRIFTCGNGGSLTDAMHFAQECSGRFRKARAPLAVEALSDPAEITCIANDFGYKEVFARQVEARAHAGDVLVLLSTSGESENVVHAASVAQALGVHTVALTGRGGGRLIEHAEIAIVVPLATTADRIQEVHHQILHAVVEVIEDVLFD